MNKLLSKVSLERGLIGGFVLSVGGLVGLIFSFLYWHGQGFRGLNYEHALRLTIPSATALIVGFQIIFGGFFVSILGIRHTRHPAVGTLQDVIG